MQAGGQRHVREPAARRVVMVEVRAGRASTASTTAAWRATSSGVTAGASQHRLRRNVPEGVEVEGERRGGRQGGQPLAYGVEVVAAQRGVRQVRDVVAVRVRRESGDAGLFQPGPQRGARAESPGSSSRRQTASAMVSVIGHRRLNVRACRATTTRSRDHRSNGSRHHASPAPRRCLAIVIGIGAILLGALLMSAMSGVLAVLGVVIGTVGDRHRGRRRWSAAGVRLGMEWTDYDRKLRER